MKADPGFRWLAAVPGVLSGLGVRADVLIVWFQKQRMHSGEIALVKLAGAPPGIGLFALMKKLLGKDEGMKKIHGETEI